MSMDWKLKSREIYFKMEIRMLFKGPDRNYTEIARTVKI